MVVQESLLGESFHFINSNEILDETLSFSDLSWEDLDPESSGSISSSTSEEQDYFEFSSPELSPSSTPENLVFCGKIISYRKPDTENNSSIGVESNNKETSIKKTHGSWGMFGWSKRSTTLKHKNGKYKFPMRVLTSTSSGKSRLCLFLFGVPKISSKMEMSDIKSRQSRHSPPPSPAVTVLNHRNDDGEVYRATSGVSGLIRILICGGNHHQNTMIY